MTESDDYLRKHLIQAAKNDAFRVRLEPANDSKPHGPATGPAISPAVSLIITSHQRAALRELGFSDEAIRQMTPAEAHEHLGLTKARP